MPACWDVLILWNARMPAENWMGIFPLALSTVLANRHGSNNSSTSRLCNSFTPTHTHCNRLWSGMETGSETITSTCKAFHLQREQALHISCTARALIPIVYRYLLSLLLVFPKVKMNDLSASLCMLLHVSITLPLLTVCSGIWQLFHSTELLWLPPLPAPPSW